VTNFIPEQPKTVSDVPFFEDVSSAQGWQGQTTTKSVDTLKSEILMAISRLAGSVTGYQKGKFLIGDRERLGYRVMYNIETGEGNLVPGRIDIAALPVKRNPPSSYDTRCEKSLKMALFMLRDSFDGLWFLQQLSPGFAPLLPFMLSGNGDLTISQLWSETSVMRNLLPPGENDFIDGEVKEL
jgi:hypothetical protein